MRDNRRFLSDKYNFYESDKTYRADDYLRDGDYKYVKICGGRPSRFGINLPAVDHSVILEW